MTGFLFVLSMFCIIGGAGCIWDWAGLFLGFGIWVAITTATHTIETAIKTRRW